MLSIAVVSRFGCGTLNPDAGDLVVTAGWGHSGKGGVTMPGKGKIILNTNYNTIKQSAYAWRN